MAIKLKNADAMINLATIFRNGLEVKKDIPEAIRLY
jgi:TPR repeat protein